MPEAVKYRSYIGAMLMHENFPGCPFVFRRPESHGRQPRAHLGCLQDNAAQANQV